MYHFDKEGSIMWQYNLGAVIDGHYHEAQIHAYSFDKAARKLCMLARKQLRAKSIYDIHELRDTGYYDDEDAAQKEAFIY